MSKLKTKINELADYVRKAENDYISGTTTISKYVEFSQYENIEKIDAYLNSKHISGATDSLDRDKPFFNIVTAACNIWYRATDIDRKNIRIKADKLSNYIPAFVASIHLQEWMRKTGFGQFLNEWGRSLARYGSSVVKFVEKDGLKASVIPWNRLITDTVDFESNPKIEILWYTPAQLLKNKSYDKEMVERLIDTRESRESTSGQDKDSKADYIKVYEVHGELPLSYLTGKVKDEDDYAQQMHVLSFVAKKEGQGYDDFCLYKGKEASDPYMITHLIKEDGRAQGIGAVEHLMEAQWMVNHSQKAIKDRLDLASRLIFQTSDGNFIGQNVLTAIETGDILIHTPNAPLTQLNNDADISGLQAFANQWQVLAQEITNTPDALRGDNAPSGTAWRQVEALRQESHSLFELMTENKGLHIEEMMRNYVIPHLKKQMDTSDELTATLDSQSLSQFDSIYVPNEAIKRDNAQLKATILSNIDKPVDDLSGIAENLDPNQVQGDIKKELGRLGNQRFIKPSDIEGKKWKEVLKDLEWEVELDVTNEETDTQAVIATLNTVLQTVAANPLILQDPNMRMLFNTILEKTGAISPIQLSQVAPQPQPMTQAPQGAEQPVGQSTAAQPTPNPNV
jgi:hypothetical protein